MTTAPPAPGWPARAALHGPGCRAASWWRRGARRSPFPGARAGGRAAGLRDLRRPDLAGPPPHTRGDTLPRRLTATSARAKAFRGRAGWRTSHTVHCSVARLLYHTLCRRRLRARASGAETEARAMKDARPSAQPSRRRRPRLARLGMAAVRVRGKPCVVRPRATGFVTPHTYDMPSSRPSKGRGTLEQVLVPPRPYRREREELDPGGRSHG